MEELYWDDEGFREGENQVTTSKDYHHGVIVIIPRLAT